MSTRPLLAAFRRPALVLAGGIAVTALALGLRLPGRDPLVGLALVIVPGLWLAAGLRSLRTAERRTAPPAALAWRYLGTGWLLFAISGALSWGIWALSGAIPTTPTLVDLFRLAGVCSVLWAVASYSSAPQERFGRLRSWLDVAILFLAVLGVAWMGLARPVLQALIVPEVSVYWALAWPVFAIAYLSLLLRLVLLARAGAERRSFAWLMAGGGLALAADVVGGYALLTGTAASLPAVAGLHGLAGMAAFVAGWQADLSPLTEAGGARPRTRAANLEAMLPIAYSYGVVGLTGVDAWLSGSFDQFGLGMSIALTLLVFARQGVVAGQSEMRQYAALVEGAADMAFICRPDGRITFSNPAFSEALGRSSVGTGVTDVMNAEVDPGTILEQASASGWQGEVTFTRGDGSRFPARLSLRPVRLERQPRPVLAASAVDLTVVKEREALLRSALDDVAAARTELETLNRELEAKVADRTQELQRTVRDLDRLNQELRALDRLKSEFVTLVSHELRAPLTNIRTGVELLVAESDLPQAPRTALGLILEETDRLAGFVEAILDLSALEAGRFPLRIEAVDLGLAAAEASRRFSPSVGPGRIELRLPADAPPVQADRRAVASVLHHLLDNAVKYGGMGTIEVSAEIDRSHVRVSVTDHGPGIPEEERERVFDRFHRLDTRDAQEVYGHGLGLHLARRLLEAMGGGIRAEATPGGGACLVFWLPWAPADGGR